MKRPYVSRERFLLSAMSSLTVVGCSGGGTSVNAPSPAVEPVTPPLLPSSTTNAAFSASSTGGTTTLNATYAGLSYEKSSLSGSLWSGSNVALIALFNLLGSSVLRVGGNSVEKIAWTPGGPGRTSGQVAPSDIDALAAFLRACNWQIIYGINLAQNTAASAAQEAAYVANALGSSLYGFEIGNEPDLYYQYPAYPTALETYAGFIAGWETFAAAIAIAAPGIPFTGPATASHTSTYAVPFASDEASRIVLLTQHYYRGAGTAPASTIDLLLTPDPKLPPLLSTLVAAASTNGLRGVRIAECGSFYSGGAPNVSDAYGSALWVVDFLFILATAGVTGANFHGGGDSSGYTPIADNNGIVEQARPEFYGMLFFAQAAKGRLTSTTLTSGPASFSAYSIARTDGSLGVVVINKDATTAVDATVALDHSATSFTTFALTGSGLLSTTGTLIGNAPIGSDGSWIPRLNAPTAISGTTFTVAVPPATALLLTIR